MPEKKYPVNPYQCFVDAAILTLLVGIVSTVTVLPMLLIVYLAARVGPQLAVWFPVIVYLALAATSAWWQQDKGTTCSQSLLYYLLSHPPSNEDDGE